MRHDECAAKGPSRCGGWLLCSSFSLLYLRSAESVKVSFTLASKLTKVRAQDELVRRIPLAVNARSDVSA